MLSVKDISKQFEVQTNTLYNWRKSKPKLYVYLQNADYNIRKNEELNLLLDFYSETISRSFFLDEIIFIIECELELNTIDEVHIFHTLFVKKTATLYSDKIEKILRIYDKIKELNIIEKYILYKKIYKARRYDSIDKKNYFSEFLSKES